MNAPPRSGMLRLAAIVLVPAGLGLHLWLGTKVGLALAGIGLACHLLAGALARRWLRKQIH